LTKNGLPDELRWTMFHDRFACVAMSISQYAHGRPENGAVCALRGTTSPFTSTRPIAIERMCEAGVFWSSWRVRKSRNAR
jgi:hypothetical protein